MAGHALLAFRRVEHDRARLTGRFGFLDALDVALVEARELDAGVVDGLQHGIEVALLGARELGPPVHDMHPVLLGQPQRVLDRRIAGTDHDNGLVAVGLRVVELVLDDRRIFAGHAELARIALGADRENHVLGLDGLAVLQCDAELALAALDAGHLRAEADVDLLFIQPALPPVEDLLARAGPEAHRRAQVQEVRLGHHVLALLVAMDGLGRAVERLEEDVRGGVIGVGFAGLRVVFRRPAGRTQASRSRADDCDVEVIGHEWSDPIRDVLRQAAEKSAKLR